VSQTEKQHQILFVDDEPDFLQMVIDTFGPLSAGAWQMHRAHSADEALKLLQQQTFDLAVVDINMPVLDGVQFLRILGRRYPDLKKVTLTGLATEEKRNECLSNGAELFIEKPGTPEGCRAVYVMLEELLSWAPKAGFQGMLRQVGLQDVIQMECLGRNSSVLEIHNQQLRGRVYIEDGNIIHAAVGDLTGEPAFQKILSLAGGSFQLSRFEKPAQRTIEGPWEFLLMEAARVRDESAGPAQVDALTAGALGAEPPVEKPEVTASQPPEVRVSETLICSGRGEPLLNWQCADAVARVSFLKDVAKQAALLGQTISLGNFDRYEMQFSDGRAVAQTRADRMVFVRVVNEAPAA
jgi:CheY-like chemotaxis protein